MELWENVFRYLPLRCLGRVAQVCWLFAQVPWPVIVVDGVSMPLTENMLRYLLSKKPKVESLRPTVSSLIRG